MSDLHAAERSPLFAELEGTSSEWRTQNADALSPYSAKWVVDPLHQWSRRWEYPFVAQAIKGSGARTILDAGAGFTFFPYYAAAIPGVESVICVDSDDLAELYTNVVSDDAESVEFRRGDLRELPVADAEVDAAYCISVLEHTQNYEEVVPELRRVLAPGGLLAITFDISLDGLAEIPASKAERLVALLSDAFEPILAPQEVDSKADGLLTTAVSASLGRERLPWRHPFLSLAKSALRRGRLPTARMKNLACYGAVLQRSAR
jgi:SAM-dependent methyltransferase